MANLNDALGGSVDTELLADLNAALQNQAIKGKEVVSAPGALDPNARFTELQVDGTDAFTLADGSFVGQIKEIWCSAATTVPVGTLTPANLNGLTTVTFDAVDEYVKLMWNGTAWDVVQNAGATLA